MKSVKDTLLIALARYVAISDFKDVKKKFLNQGKEESAVDIVLDDFKELKKLQKIKDKEQKDIAYWGKQGFEELKTFVDNLKATPSKSEEKKLKKMEGAEKVAENDKWGVYRITTHEASCYYGGGTKWCITEQNSSHFEDYIRKNNFYFLISKTRDSDDPLYKIALMVDKEGDRTYFDAEDKQIADIPASIREELPEFDPESAEGIPFC